jgi:hypothetical protein
MIRIGAWSIYGPVSAIRALREPPFQAGQIRHYEPGPGVGSWSHSSDDLTRSRGVSGRIKRWFAMLIQPAPRLQSVTPPATDPNTDSGAAGGPKG